LIMRGTLEEKVMSLQKFKVSVANAVINAENASLKTMNTDQLLDLFGSAETRAKVLLRKVVTNMFWENALHLSFLFTDVFVSLMLFFHLKASLNLTNLLFPNLLLVTFRCCGFISRELLHRSARTATLMEIQN